MCLSDNEGERGLVEFSRYKKIFLQKDAPHERRKEGEREDRTERRKTSNTFIATATDTTTTYSNGFVHAFNYVDETSDMVCDFVSDVVSSSSIYHLECLPDVQAAELTFKTVFGDGK